MLYCRSYLAPFANQQWISLMLYCRSNLAPFATSNGYRQCCIVDHIWHRLQPAMDIVNAVLSIIFGTVCSQQWTSSMLYCRSYLAPFAASNGHRQCCIVDHIRHRLLPAMDIVNAVLSMSIAGSKRCRI